ncbi:putative holin-like toxin [Metabacillus litoralis]
MAKVRKLKGGQRYPKGKGVTLMMTVFQTLMLMIAFASLVLSIISYRDKK